MSEPGAPLCPRGIREFSYYIFVNEAEKWLVAGGRLDGPGAVEQMATHTGRD